MRVLVIATDRRIVEMLTGWLKDLGYEVHSAFTGEQAKIKWMENPPDLVIVDTTLKNIDVLAICRDLQSKHDALLLVMGGGQDIHDEVCCLEAGADDYLRKPFSPAQLLARIHALSRRVHSSVEKYSSLIKVGPICIDSARNEVSVHGKIIRLTPTQGRLLKLLATNADNVCTLEQIMTDMWRFGDAGDASLIKAHIYRLRKKIEQDPNNPRYILTAPGRGYMLVHRPYEDPNTLRRNVADQLRIISR